MYSLSDNSSYNPLEKVSRFGAGKRIAAGTGMELERMPLGPVKGAVLLVYSQETPSGST